VATSRRPISDAADPVSRRRSGHTGRLERRPGAQQPDGSPAGFESVFATDASSVNPGGNTITDANGFYSISGLVPGPYHVRIIRYPFNQYAHGRTTPWTADTFTVAAGETTTVDIVVPAG
jgi:Carboxypeptidase regulatory-like domain